MTDVEWKQTASQEAIEQFDMPKSWFSRNVKCCYNCSHWEVDHSLMFDYKYNFCACHPYMTADDCWCSDYEGNAVVDHLIDYLHINWTEVENKKQQLVKHGGE